MNKSTALRVTLAIGVLAVLLVATTSIRAARSYASCAVELLNHAPASDSNPPESFRRQARKIWTKRDLFLVRALAESCDSRSLFLPRQVVALGSIKASLTPAQRDALAAVLIYAHGGRGITRSASAEFGKLPAELSESEMAWLFVVGQQPDCSKRLTPSEAEGKFCSSLREGLLARLSVASPVPPPGMSDSPSSPRAEGPIAASPLHLPTSFPVSSTGASLRSKFGLADVFSMKHPEYSESLMALVTRDDDGGYELAFYERRGQSYQVIDASQAVFGSFLPTLAEYPGTHLPALRAQMRPTNDAYFFFIQDGKLRSEVEHPERWTTIKEPSPSAN